MAKDKPKQEVKGILPLYGYVSAAGALNDANSSNARIAFDLNAENGGRLAPRAMGAFYATMGLADEPAIAYSLAEAERNARPGYMGDAAIEHAQKVYSEQFGDNLNDSIVREVIKYATENGYALPDETKERLEQYAGKLIDKKIGELNKNDEKQKQVLKIVVSMLDEIVTKEIPFGLHRGARAMGLERIVNPQPKK